MNRHDPELSADDRASWFLFGAPWWVWLIAGALAWFGYSRLAENRCHATRDDPFGIIAPPRPRS